jgi:hypothetical protein
MALSPRKTPMLLPAEPAQIGEGVSGLGQVTRARRSGPSHQRYDPTTRHQRTR